MTPKELREKRARLVTEARAKLDEITDKTPEARAAELEGEFNSMMAEAGRLLSRAEALEQSDAALASLEEGQESNRPEHRGQSGAGDARARLRRWNTARRFRNCCGAAVIFTWWTPRPAR
ncbi:hypothetical protein [Sulfitobacter profundi]|uniref:Uncharacterized protein n=1 Tax=Sulfitobacter profundi TaxID=2679961 RepID=A0ABW1YUC8_9RHOB